MNRAERIHRKHRNLAHWRKIVKRWGYSPYVPENHERLAQRAAAHGKLCSCWMCGNRRASEGPSIQERRATANRGAEHG